MARTVIDELVTVVEFESDTKGLDKASRSISSFKTGALAALAPIVALFSGGLFINSIVNAADEMLKFADATGVSVEGLQDLEFAAKRQGGTIDGLRGSIERLSEKMGEAFSLGTGEGVEVFEKLGISLIDTSGKLKSATNLMLELNTSFQTLSRGEQISFAAKLGIDVGTLRLLQTAPNELQKLIEQSKNFGRITREDALEAAKFNDELTNLDTQFTRITQVIGLSVLPALTEFLIDFGEVVSFIKDNSEFFIILAESIAGTAVAFGVLTGAIRIMTAASFVAGIAAVFNPFTLAVVGIAAVGTALGFLIDDFNAWRAGADSAFGGFFDEAEIKINRFLKNLELIKRFLTTPLVDIKPLLSEETKSDIDSLANLVGIEGKPGQDLSGASITDIFNDLNVPPEKIFFNIPDLSKLTEENKPVFDFLEVLTKPRPLPILSNPERGPIVPGNVVRTTQSVILM